MNYNCLIVDDEKPLAESTAEYFNLFGVTSKAVFSAWECRQFFTAHTADLILLDINLEESSGFDLCRELRLSTQVPILFISARQTDDDMLLALNIGGDDYICKPYSLSVLLAKVKVVLKRCRAPRQEVYECGHLKIDYRSGQVYVNQAPIRLKAMEYKLLCYLVSSQGRIVPKEELFEQVWEDTVTGDGTLNVHIRHLREKIETDPGNPRFIRTIWSRGYIFEECRE